MGPTLTLYHSARNTTPAGELTPATWADFEQAIEELLKFPPECSADLPPKEQKTHLPCVAPHRIREGGTRRDSDVEAVTMCVLDVDAFPVDHFDEFLQRVDALQLTILAYGSPSDDEASDVRRLRIMAPVSREVLPGECARLRCALAEALGLRPGMGVEEALDPSRLFFIGRLHGSPERMWCSVNSGIPLDVDAFLAAELELDWNPRRPTPLGPGPSGRAPGVCLDRARQVAQWMPSSVEGLGGDAALFAATKEITTHLGADPEAILQVLREDFNPRCVPPWDDAKLRREAYRAANSVEGIASGILRRRESEAEGTVTHLPEGETSPWDDPYVWTDEDDPPLEYLCEALRLAPSRGKISMIAGQPNSGKGPFADYLAVCFATGRPLFGKYPVKKTKVVLLDCEGRRLTVRRIKRFAKAMGVSAAELNEGLRVIDASTLEDLGDQGNLDRLASLVAGGHEVVILDSYTSAMLPTGIDSKDPNYAKLARSLGSLGACVIAVGHSNKASKDGRPSLQDISGTGAIGAMAQTAIMLSIPDPDNATKVTIHCARAPERGFATIYADFVDTPDGGLDIVELPPPEAIEPEGPKEDAGRDLRRLQVEEARISRDCEAVLSLLDSVDHMGQGWPSRKLQTSAGVTGERWTRVLQELTRREAVEVYSLPSQTDTHIRRRE